MKTAWRYLFLLFGTAAPLIAQNNTGPISAIFAGTMPEEPGITADGPQDSGHQLYRKGFTLILEERWREARETFERLAREYPQSSYRDDASYWSAYALRHTDREKAIDAYRTFVKEFRRSPYLPDAIADLTQIETQKVTSHATPRPGATEYDVSRFYYEFQQGNVPTEIVQRIKKFTEDAARLSRVFVTNGTTNPGWQEAEPLDQETRLRLQAVAALRASRDDEQSFVNLRTIATDPQEPRSVRFVALQTLVGARRHDPIPVLLQVAREDTNQDIQTAAINLIRVGAKDKDRKIEALEKLFTSLPPDRTVPLGTALYGIAEVGNDRAVDFLGKVAQSHDSYDLRSEAIFYLGNLSSEKARKTLVRFLKEQKE